ncbi:hypothetical protein BDV98DRAFT_609112 [Pterulicium gracile]|uniref:AA1-like domain-containing protein n=1 Tax=Pterulicium gracile TaxID=1884261 RepID=A0A5C3PZ69_9AGAR|nr:hypothetical protein BDV98DRAFT_609112 [Pterula gracilis]
MFSPITPLSFALLALIPSAIARPATSRRAANQRKCKAPVEPSCTKFATGVLSADVNGTLSPFTLVDPLGSISFKENETRPLEVEYQTCKHFTNSESSDSDIPGRLYVPEFRSCIKVLNQPDETEPYFTLLSEVCDSSFGERFVLRPEENNTIFWTGSTNSTFEQGGCGELGYRVEEDGTPVLTENGVALGCEGKPFNLVLVNTTE